MFLLHHSQIVSLGLFPHGHKMAATAQRITISHHHIHRQEEKGLALHTFFFFFNKEEKNRCLPSNIPLNLIEQNLMPAGI